MFTGIEGANLMKRKFYLAALAALLSAAIGSAFAAKHMENDALAITSAKVGLVQAASAAERHVGGQASRAELEDENGKLVYGVEVVRGRDVTDVKVDANDGRILSAQADKADQEHEGRGEERDDD
jgi:uncharacterized membrane protein YkoI